MSQIKKLTIGLGIDLPGLFGELDKASAAIAGVGKGAAPVKLGAAAGAGAGAKAGDDSAAKVEASFGQTGNLIASRIGNAIQSANGPLTALSAHMNEMFDRVGGTIVTTFQRIDASMKFPKIDEWITRTKLGLFDFGKLWGKATDPAEKSFAKAVRSAGPLGPILGEVVKALNRMVSLMERLGSAASAPSAAVPILGQIAAGADKVAVAESRLFNPLKALGSAWDALKTRAAAARAEMELAGNRGPAAGRRPGRGRAVNLPRADLGGVDRALAGAAAYAERLGAFLARIGPVADAGFSQATRAAQIFARVESVTGRAMDTALAAPLRVVSLLAGGFVSVAQSVWRARGAMSSLGDVSDKTYSGMFEKNGRIMSALSGLARGMLRVGTLGIFGRAKKDADGMTTSLGKAQTATAGLSGSIRSFGRDVLVAFGVFGLAFKAVQFLKDGVQAASNLNETVSKSKTVFGSSFGVVQKQADGMTKAFRISKREQLDIASGFGAMAQGAGMSEKASAGFANQMTKLAADFGSSANLPFAEAAEKIQSALAGNAEPLRKFGADITEAKVEAQALSMGLASVSRSGKTVKVTVDEVAKVQARAALISKGLAYAQGDLARTADGAANQFRKAGGGVAQFGELIGGILLPAVNVGVTAFNELLATVLDVFETNRPTVEAWGASLATVMNGVGSLIRNFGDYWEIATLRVGAFVENTLRWIGTLPENFGRVTAWVGRNWQNLFVDFVTIQQTAFTDLGENAVNFASALWDALQGKGFNFEFKPLLAGFKAATEALPEILKPALVNVEGEVDKIFNRIQAKDMAVPKVAEAAKPKVAEAAKAADTKPVETKLAAAVEVNSKEAYSAITKNSAEGRRGSSDKIADVAKTAREQLAESRKQTAILDRRTNPAAGLPAFDIG